MFQISKSFRFEAAHRLDHLPPEHKCSRPHGHSYEVTLVLEWHEVNANGFVQDYASLDAFGNWLKDNLDHHDLNAYNGIYWQYSTAEMLAEAFFYRARNMFPGRIAGVMVKETEKTSAVFRPDKVIDRIPGPETTIKDAGVPVSPQLEKERDDDRERDDRT